MNEESKEWHLSVYRCFRESDSNSHTDQNNASSTNETENNSKTKEDAQIGGIWLTRRDHSAAALIIRISQFAHLVIMQGSEIVESFFLILAKKWIKMINIDAEIMFHIRERNKIRRLRLTFGSVDDARSCYKHLSQYVSVKPPSNASEDIEWNRLSEEEDNRVAHYLSLMTSLGSKSAQTEAAWHTNWPTDRLAELVKLCLNDANFPGFVKQVQECLSILAPLKAQDHLSTQDQMEE